MHAETQHDDFPNGTHTLEELVAALPRRHDDDPDIVEVLYTPAIARVLAYAVVKGHLKAAFLKPTTAQSALRAEFRANVLTPQLWEKIAEHHKNPAETETHIPPQFSYPYYDPTPEYLTEMQKFHFDIVSDVDATKIILTSMILARTPNNAEGGFYPEFHTDDFPASLYTAIKGAGMRYVIGNLSKKERKLYSKDAEKFAASLPKNRIGTVEPGITAIFNPDLIHQSSPRVREEGQLVVVSDYEISSV